MAAKGTKGSKTKCMLCGEEMPIKELANHVPNCLVNRDVSQALKLKQTEAIEQRQCLTCFEYFFDNVFARHAEMCRGARVQCSVCRKFVWETELEQHNASDCKSHRCSMCHLMFSLRDIDQHSSVCAGPLVECEYCFENVAKSQLASHQATCSKTPKCPFCRMAFPAAEIKAHCIECTGPVIACPVCKQQVSEQTFTTHLGGCAEREAKSMRYGCRAPLESIAITNQQLTPAVARALSPHTEICFSRRMRFSRSKLHARPCRMS